MPDPTVMDLPLNQISDDQFKTFFDDYMGEKGVREKSVVKGRVIGISDDWITVDMATGDCIPEPDSGTHSVVENPFG